MSVEFVDIENEDLHVSAQRALGILQDQGLTFPCSKEEVVSKIAPLVSGIEWLYSHLFDDLLHAR